MNEKYIREEFNELYVEYPCLRLLVGRDECWNMKGLFKFSADYPGYKKIVDEYQLNILISHEYPHVLPRITETAGRIPDNFHKYSDGTLCLGSSLNVRQNFMREPSILGFVKYCVIPYLYQYSYYEKYGEMVWGERPHGGKGIAISYYEYFDIKDNNTILEFLKILDDNNYRGHWNCPCGSQKKNSRLSWRIVS